MPIRALFVFLFFTILHQVQGQSTFESNQSGRWDQNKTWNLISGSGKVPGASDNVIIKPGHTIQIFKDESSNNLTFTGGGISFTSNRTLQVNGNLNVTANSSIAGYSNDHIFDVSGNFTLNSGVTFDVGAVSFTIDGNSTINGNLEITGYGAKPRNFGDIEITSSGSMTCSGADAYSFNGDLTNNGSFTATSFGTTFAFKSSSGIIAGTGLLSFFEISIEAGASYTNQGNVQIRDSMSGSGSFTNGNGGELELQNGGPFTVSTFDASATGNIITYTGSGSPTGFSGSYYNLVIDKSSGTLGFSGAPTILNDLAIKGGIFQVAAVTVTIGNDLLIQGGEFTPDNTSAVVNIGGDMNVSSGEYDHNNGDVNVTGNIAVTGGNFFLNGGTSTIDAGSVSLENVALTMSQGTLTTTGNFDLDTGSDLTANGADFNIGGTFNHNAGGANFTGGSLSAANIIVDSGNEIFINAIDFSVTGQIELDGTMTFNNSTGSKSVGSVLVNATGNWNVTQPLNITITGDITNNGTFTGEPGYGTNIYTLSATNGTLGGSNSINLTDIVINSPGSYTNQTELTVSNTLTGTGTFINGTGATFRYRGDNSSGSNFTISNFNPTANNNTVIYAGTTFDQQFRTTTGSNNDYFNVKVELGTGDYQDLILMDDIRVNGTLTITEGDVKLGNNDLELGASATISGGDANDWIRLNGTGVLRQYYSGVGGSLNFPIGDNNDYSPIQSFNLKSATLGGNASVSFSIIDNVHPNRDSDNTNAGGNDNGDAAVDYLSRYWSIAANNITSPKYDLNAVYTDADVIGTELNLIGALYREVTFNGNTFDDWLETGTVNNTNNTISITDADNWGDVYAMDNDMLRLPVELISFEIAQLNSIAQLTWKTATEENNSHFSVQRSVNGRDFEELAIIEGKGTTSILQNYVFSDSNPPLGRVYYRLKQVDFSGQHEYSEVISAFISYPASKESFLVYPNPIQIGNTLNISIKDSSKSGEWHLVNLNGVVVLNGNLFTQSVFKIETVNLQAGIYILKIKLENGIQLSKKIIVN